MADKLDGTTYNTDIYGFAMRMNRFIIEIIKSQSSGNTGTMNADVQRIKKYVTALRSYLAWVVAMPILDLPETGPRSVKLPESPVIPPMENDSLFDIATMLEMAREELTNSDSSRASTNLNKFDQIRLVAILDKIDKFIDGYVVPIDPLDVPESAPSVPMTGAGLGGV